MSLSLKLTLQAVPGARGPVRSSENDWGCAEPSSVPLDCTKAPPPESGPIGCRAREQPDRVNQLPMDKYIASNSRINAICNGLHLTYVSDCSYNTSRYVREMGSFRPDGLFLGEARPRRGSYIPTPLVKEPYL